MIFQEPMTSLNPIFRVGTQISGEVHGPPQGAARAEARQAAVELLARVGIPDPEKPRRRHPHQMSGGMKQRVMIAMALACNPKLLIADEPTTALDVTVQAQILLLLKQLQVDQNMGMVLITHDLGVVAEVADRVVVMYAGRVVESAPAEALFRRPRHPYTLGLFRSLPRVTGPRERLATIPGMVPRATQYPTGCRFRGRCGFGADVCGGEPQLSEVAPNHFVACQRLDAVLEDRGA
jgi:peptide/nickel transport system ATP-binding protein